MSSSSSPSGQRLDPVERLLERVTIDRDCLPEGSPVGSFVLHEVLERGDFSVFYRAGSSASASTVLIEEYFPLPLASRNAEGELVVRESSFTPWFAAGLEAFVEETQQLSQPSHAALVTLGPVWRLRNTAYRLRIEHAGALLTQHLDERDRPPEERWLRALAEPLMGALEAVHQAGRVHGNVRPENIVLQAEGLLPLLLEFGAARAAVARAAPWLAAPLEPDFAAPELQLYGAVPTPAADLYSLAAVLVYCMLGEVPAPSRASDKRTGQSRLNAMIEELQRRHPTLHYSEPFVAALERALSFDPESRPHNVDAFRQDLARPPAVRPPPVVAPPVVRAPVVEAPREIPRPAARPEPGLFADPAGAPRPVAAPAVDSAREPLWHLPQFEDDDRQSGPPTLTQEAWARLSEPMPLSAPMPLLSSGGRIEADPWPVTRTRVAPKPRRWPWLVGGAFVGAAAMVLVGFGVERFSDDERLARLLGTAPAALGALLPGPAGASASATTPLAAPAFPASAAAAGVMPAAPDIQKAAPVATAGVAAGSLSGVANVTAGVVPRPAAAASAPLPRKPAVAAAAPRETVALKGSESRPAATRAQPLAVTDPTEACAPRTNFSLYLCVKRQCEQSQFYAHPQCVQQRREDQP